MEPSLRTHYSLFMRKKIGPVFNEDDLQARIFFVFCLSNRDRHVQIQRWKYGGLVYDAWEENAGNPLAWEARPDAAMYGHVRMEQVADPKSTLRTTISLSKDDMDRHDAAWKEWRDKMVAERAKKGKSEVPEGVTREETIAWQSQFFMSLANEKITKLRSEGIVRTCRRIGCCNARRVELLPSASSQTWV